jgi:hypothetical protein|tara:strand:- start:684 stop:872 length:189 start_codon:yes stop_codon:yes gene_type:complete
MSVAKKLSKTDDNFTVTIADNGFLVDVGGRDKQDEWAGTKVVCNSLEELVATITEITSLPRS